MDLMFFAFAVDICLWVLAGYLVSRVGRKWLPRLLSDARLVMVVFFIIGALVTMVSFPHWAIYPE